MELFMDGSKQTILDVLEDRDRRVAEQKALLKNNPTKTLIVIKLNIPGPIKNNAKLHQLFVTGVQQFLRYSNEFQVVSKWNHPAGNTWFILSSLSSIEVKKMAIKFEDHDPMGRFFDVDVLTDNNDQAISRSTLGLPVRTCFICGKPAKECARSRNHSVLQLQGFIEKRYQDFLEENDD